MNIFKALKPIENYNSILAIFKIDQIFIVIINFYD